MSASTELLVEEIKQVETQIVEAQTLGNGAETMTMLRSKLTQLQRKLASNNEALTEGAQKILKG